MDSKLKNSALLIIDCINELNFDGSERLLPWAEALVSPLLRFRRAAHANGIPVVYINDNLGKWEANFDDIVKYCARPASMGRNLTLKLAPGKRDYKILKARHSAFFHTPLVPLLEDLNTERVILAGIATNLCVFFTAHDAHMLGYGITVLSDCCASESDFDHNIALTQLKKFCGAEICRASELSMPYKKPKKRRP